VRPLHHQVRGQVMGARSGRLWMIGGAAVVVLLAAAGYFLLISPKYAEAKDVAQRTADTQDQIIVLRKRNAELIKQEKQLPTYEAQLANSQKALPSSAGMSDFLNQLQAAGDNVGVQVNGLSVSAPTQATAASGVWELPLTLTAVGDTDKLSAFLTQLQNVQPRAVLIKSVDFKAGSTAADSGATQPTMNLTLTTFVAPPAGSGTPIVTTK
jgi:Tfp pilus assembly protein PilO